MSGSSSPAPLSPSSSSPPLPSSASVLSSMLDTDDPFNTRKKKPLLPTSPSSLDDLPLTGNRTAQRLTRYPDNSDPEAGKENTHDAHGRVQGGRRPSLPHHRSPPVKKPREPRVPLRARVKATAPSSSSPPPDEPSPLPPPSSISHSYDPPASAADSDDPPPIPRSSAATLAAMLDTDDPFNTKKKGGSTGFGASMAASLEDMPIAGSKAAQAMSANPEEGEEAPLKGVGRPARPFLEEEGGEGEAPPPPARAAPPARRPPVRKTVAVEEREEGGGEDEESAEVVAPVKKRPPLRTRPKPSAAAEPPLAEDGGAAAARGEAAEAAPSAFDDAPIPRSSAASLAAMLDTDDPFNTKKKPLMSSSLEDMPIGGSKTAQAMSAYPDDDPAHPSSDDAFSPAPPPRRPPVKPKPKPAAEDDTDAPPSDSNPSPAPRRPPAVKAKAKVEKKEEKGDASAGKKSSATTATPAAAGGAAAAAPVKYDAYKGEGVMDVEEAEAELKEGGVISEAVWPLLSSKKWSEVVEGLTAMTTEVEALGADDAVPHLPALLSVLSRAPSFKAANFNVCRAVYDCYASALSLYLHSSSTTFPLGLAYHPLSDALNKLSDAKLVDSIHALLTVMAECAGPRFVYNHVAQCVTRESFKSVKAQEAAVHWLVSLVNDFGLGALDVLGLIEQSHLWLQSTSKGVKEDALQLLLSVYRQSGQLFREKMLMGLKPTTAKELEGLFASVPADRVGQSTATKWKKGDSEPAALNLDLLVPRVDLSALVTEKLLKRMQDDNWKERKEAMDEVELLLKQHNMRIQPKDGGVLEVLGKWRLVDKNKNLSRDALALVSLFCAAMGKPISTYRDKLVPNLFVCLADSKKLVKDEAMKTVEVWVECAGLASVSKYLPKALMVAGSRQELLDLINRAMADSKRMKKEKKDMDMDELIPPVISCLQDKLSEVRVTAERTCTLLAQFTSFDALQDHMKNLKKAEVLKIQPILDRVKKAMTEGTAGDGKGGAAAAAAEAKEEEVEDSKAKKASATTKPSSAAAGKAAKPSASAASTLKKGAVEAAKAAEREKAAEVSAGNGGVPAESAGSGELVRRVDQQAKSVRVKRDAKRVKGSFREWGSDEVEEMSEKMRELLSEPLHALLFHKDFAKQVTACEQLDGLIASNMDGLLSVLDLVLRWCSWRMCDANTALLLKLLAFLTSLFQHLLDCSYSLQEGEANDLLPFLIEKVLGHNNPKFRQDSKDLLRLSARLYDEKATFTLVTAGLESKNKRVQSECIELACELMLQYGLQVGDVKRLVPNIALQVGAQDAAVRAAALSCMGGLYERYGEAVYGLMGGKKGGDNSKVPPKQMAMIEERFKRIKPGTAAGGVVEDAGAAGAGGGGTAAAMSRPSVGVGAGKTPQKKPTPSTSVNASPRLPLARSLAPVVGRTPVRGAPLPVRGHGADEEEVGESAAGGGYDAPSYDSAHALMAPSSASAPSRKSFTASINADLPSCFSLDLDGGGGAVAALPSSTSTLSPPSDLSASAYSSYGRTSTGFTSSGYSSQRPMPASPYTSSYSSHVPSSPLPSSSSSYPPPPSSPFGLGPTPPPPIPSLPPLLSSFQTAGHPDARIESMKALWERIIESRAAIVKGSTDAVVAFLITQIEDSFHDELDPTSGQSVVVVNHRYCRYALNTLMELFKLPELIAELSVATLSSVSSLLLARLMDERLKKDTADTQSKQLMQAINVLVLKVMENSDRTAILHTLITFLYRAAQAPPPTPSSPPALTPAFVELVVRCLSKLIRTFQASGMLAIDFEQLLRDIHSYLSLPQVQVQAAAVAAGVGEAGASPDQSARAVRSILALMVQVKGEGLLADIASTLPSDTPVLPVVEKAISNWKAKNGQQTMLGSQQFTPHHRSALRMGDVFPPAQSAGSATSSFASTPFTSTPARSSLPARQERDADAYQSIASRSSHALQAVAPLTSSSYASVQPPSADLSSLVSAVLTPATTRSGLTALAAYAQAHPEVDVMAAFSGQSDSFKAYVQRNIGAAAAAGARQRPQSAGAAPSAASFPSSSASLHQRGSSLTSAQASSTDSLRERLAALQTKAKAAGGGAAPAPPAAAAAFAAPAPSVAAPVMTSLVRPSTALPSSSSSTFSTALSSSSSAAPATSRSSLSSQSMDAIKQRFAAIHTQRLSSK